MTGGIDVRNGWLKLWYKSEDNPIFQDGILMAVFVKLLLRASKFDTVLPDGTEIKRGQAIISQRGLADSLMFGRMQIRRALVALERMGAITQKATHKPAQCPTIVTICKYRDYQDKNQDDNPVPSPVAAQYQPSSSPVAAQLKEGRKKKEEEEQQESNSKELPTGFGPLFICRDMNPAYLTEFEYQSIKATIGDKTDAHLLHWSAESRKPKHPWRCARRNLAVNLIAKYENPSTRNGAQQIRPKYKQPTTQELYDRSLAAMTQAERDMIALKEGKQK